jgi:hypothetical protein
MTLRVALQGLRVLANLALVSSSLKILDSDPDFEFDEIRVEIMSLERMSSRELLIASQSCTGLSRFKRIGFDRMGALKH